MEGTAVQIGSIAGAMAARWYLHTSCGDALAARMELANHFTSWQGIREGATLAGLDISPYAGMPLCQRCAVVPLKLRQCEQQMRMRT